MESNIMATCRKGSTVLHTPLRRDATWHYTIGRVRWQILCAAQPDGDYFLTLKHEEIIIVSVIISIAWDWYNMATRRILQLDEPLLRKKSKKVKQFDEGLKTLAEDMVETMHAANGLGLAAPQVGVLERVIVVQLPEEYELPEAGRLFVLVNPEIVQRAEEEEAGEEGCLSIPGFVGEVVRSRHVVLKGQNLKGKSLRLEADEFLARVFQHEIDHLDGVLFIDRVAGPEKLRRLTEEGEARPIEAA
jgi:peptide deformylase